jgi:signal transduction histidine kinase
MPFERLLEKRAGRWALWFLFWTLIGLFYSTRMAIGGRPASYEASLKSSLAQWYIWGALAPLMVRLDRMLPVARDAVVRRALFHLPLSFLVTALYVYLFDAVRGILGITQRSTFSLAPLKASWSGGFHWYYLIYWLITGAYAAYDYSRSLRERERRTAELERLLSEARLNTLRSQLHPHFLFNTLNAISAHVERNPRVARRMLEQLGDLLRLSLEHAESQEIPLEQELAFLERYLALQKARFEDRLDAEVTAAPETLAALVPTFVLQPLVENAIKHGIGSRSTRGRVRITAWKQDGRLRLRITDDGPGLPRGWRLTSNPGVGLANTVERLKRLYGGSHLFSIAGEPGSGTCVDIEVPFQSAPAAAISYV